MSLTPYNAIPAGQLRTQAGRRGHDLTGADITELAIKFADITEDYAKIVNGVADRYNDGTDDSPKALRGIATRLDRTSKLADEARKTLRTHVQRLETARPTFAISQPAHPARAAASQLWEGTVDLRADIERQAQITLKAAGMVLWDGGIVATHLAATATHLADTLTIQAEDIGDKRLRQAVRRLRSLFTSGTVSVHGQLIAASTGLLRAAEGVPAAA